MDNRSIGSIGEYLVAAELEMRGFSVALPPSHTEAFDILAFNRTTHKTFAIQVKTNNKGTKKWLLNKKVENFPEDIFYIFVTMKNFNSPEYHIVPGKDVVKHIKNKHNEWLNELGKSGQPHNDNNLREFRDNENKWKDKWSEVLK